MLRSQSRKLNSKDAGLQQDNDPKHTSKSIKKYKLKPLEMASQSADWSINENRWIDLMLCAWQPQSNCKEEFLNEKY